MPGSTKAPRTLAPLENRAFVDHDVVVGVNLNIDGDSDLDMAGQR